MVKARPIACLMIHPEKHLRNHYGSGDVFYFRVALLFSRVVL